MKAILCMQHMYIDFPCLVIKQAVMLRMLEDYKVEVEFQS